MDSPFALPSLLLCKFLVARFRLCKLSQIHTPARINKAIDEAATRLALNGNPLKFNSFAYIYKMLRNQNSLEGTGKKSRKGNKKAVQCACKKEAVRRNLRRNVSC